MVSLFGITDPAICLGYVLSIGFALACIAYGIVYWNKEGTEGGN